MTVLRILILGGTNFLGRHLVERALARGAEVTLFNRGKTNPGLYEGVTEIHGDRTEGLKALEGLSFDSVIDPSGYFPRDVEAAAEFLKPHAPHYVFISTGSVYSDPDVEEITEKSPTSPFEAELNTATEFTAESYGPLKAECERRLQAIYGDGALVLRPGLIAGRYDKTGRFSYWPQRFRKGGEIIVPANFDAPVQFIDAHDLAEWALDLCERKASGTLSAVGPIKRINFGELLNKLMELAPEGTELVPLSDTVLKDFGVSPWVGLPLWLPEDAGARGFMAVSTEKAAAAGLTTRPLSKTVADILSEIDEEGAFCAGDSLTDADEAEFLSIWRNQG
ncbi:NAD-dependent epimerase/dehydratase family protein [bacterium AH-315-P15]|nr:NAD-dependent epimerase/dehydratase family protein [bacterium AH-315-P15]